MQLRQDAWGRLLAGRKVAVMLHYDMIILRRASRLLSTSAIIEARDYGNGSLRTVTLMQRS